MPIELNEWKDETVDNFLGGLVLDKDSELLESNELLTAQNVVIRNRCLTSDTGYIQYLNTVRGNPRRAFTYKTPAGAEHQILVTDLTVYRKVSNQWQYVSNGTSTTLNANEAQGSTALDVVSEAGFAAGEFIGIILDTGQMHFTTVASTAAGVININDALPSAAASGNAVIESVVLAGLAYKHVSGVLLPWNSWLVFTNGVDFIKRYDPAANTVVNLPGLTDTVCETIALYDSSVIIGNTTESTVRFPFRIKYCAKGDATAWASLEAGTTDFLDATSEIKQLLGLGPYLIAYRDGSIIRIGISGSGVKRFDSLVTVNDTGVFSSLAAVGLKDKHLVWGNENFFWYRGGFSVEELINPIKESVFSVQGKLTTLERRSECFTLLIKPVNEVLFVYGTSAAVQPPAERYHIDYEKFTTRQFGITVSGAGEHLSANIPGWDELSGGWEAQPGSWASLESLGETYGIILCSAGDDATYTYDFLSTTDAATAITTIVETKDFANPTYLTMHDHMDVGYRSADDVTVEYSTDKGISWTALGTLTASATTVNVRLSKQFVGRTIRFRFTCASKFSLRYLNMRYMYISQW